MNKPRIIGKYRYELGRCLMWSGDGGRYWYFNVKNALKATMI